MIRKRIFTTVCSCCIAAVVLSFPAQSLSQNQTLGTSGCGLSQNNCHTNENNWWKDDAHKVTVDAFYDDPAAYEKIAKLAGVDPANMLKGNNQCMTCHGTIVSGKEAREVEEGVSCESCHGAGSAYKDPHAEGDPKLGLQRPGYIKGLQLGMVENKNVEVRGKTCVKCHYITDPKLISAGHPDGARFNYISGVKKVAKHWKRQPGDADLNKAPFEKAMNAKGPVAQIAKVETAAAAAAAPPEKGPSPAALPESNQPALNQPAAAPNSTPATTPEKVLSPPPPAVATTNQSPTVSSNVPAMNRAAMTAPSDPPMNRMAMPMAERNSSPAMPARPAFTAPMPTAINPMMPPADSARGMALPPFPQVNDSTSIRDLLIILKKRLEMLHQATGVR